MVDQLMDQLPDQLMYHQSMAGESVDCLVDNRPVDSRSVGGQSVNGLVDRLVDVKYFEP